MQRPEECMGLPLSTVIPLSEPLPTALLMTFKTLIIKGVFIVLKDKIIHHEDDSLNDPSHHVLGHLCYVRRLIVINIRTGMLSMEKVNVLCRG